jgi:uncharacterized protein
MQKTGGILHSSEQKSLTMTIIDRRLNQGDKNLGNRQRFIRRAKQQIKNSIRHSLGNRSISDTSQGELVNIPLDGVQEPHFHVDPASGQSHRVLPGNQDFVSGDQIKKPSGGSSGSRGHKPSDSPETAQDQFEFMLTKDEFYDLLFEDLELPDLVRKQLKQSPVWVNHRSGISTTGNPSNLHVLRTLKQSWARRLVLRTPVEKQIEQLMEQLCEQVPDTEAHTCLLAQIENLKRKLRSVPYVDTLDLRYKAYAPQPKPHTQAVMFCVMDVSGSMDEHKKDVAKRFFMLLYMFLQRKYEKVILEFVRHHTQAERVDEHTFFYDKLTGGTQVSSALQLVHELIQSDYDPHMYNIYVCQASDGDNWDSDNVVCEQLLVNHILPQVQYMAYVQIADDRELAEYPLLQYEETKLYRTYEKVAATCEKLQVTQVWEIKEIYKVFRELFERK